MKLKYLKHMRAWVAIKDGKAILAGISLEQVINDAIILLAK